MARKRERWLNMAWLHWLEGDTGEGLCERYPYTVTTISQYMPTLCGLYKRYVETEKDGDAYVLRVVPRNPDVEHGGMALGLSYRGNDIHKLFAHAVWDLDRLNSEDMPYRAGRTELPRWVA